MPAVSPASTVEPSPERATRVGRSATPAGGFLSAGVSSATESPQGSEQNFSTFSGEIDVYAEP